MMVGDVCDIQWSQTNDRQYKWLEEVAEVATKGGRKWQKVAEGSGGGRLEQALEGFIG